ncbi:Eco57I restriction-modification methylase domain-containing protein, partial [Vibrio gigantis]
MRQALDKTLRKKLEDTVVKARDIVEQAVFEALQRLGVAEAQAPSYLSEEERALRNKLRAHARQLGDKLKDGKQETERLINEMAYEHWHRMLFARYLEQNNLLMYDEYTPVTLDECFELAEEEPDCKDGWELAGRLAQKMLPQIFRVDSPVFDIKLSMNRVEELESLIAQLDPQTYQAQDSLGWCYQFWQTKKKDQVNKSGVKIGAQELSPVTQLFTEPYMVSFLLDNALGAWWANKRLSQDDLIRANNEQELRELAAIPGVSLEYLRFSKEEGAESWKPAAGGFEKWPENLSELKTLDPCCGSGHFLVAVFLMLVPMRMQLEGLSEKQAVDAVLRDNIHGLELDQRCVELAAFALALEAWRYPNAGGYRALPEFQLACSGMSIAEAQKEWNDLAKGDEALTDAIAWMQHTFKDAPTLGSLIEPKIELQNGQTPPWEQMHLALEKAANVSNEVKYLTQGLIKNAQLLASNYHWVVTNVPYLKRGNQDPLLQKFCENNYPKSKGDLATTFIERFYGFCGSLGMSSSVLPQNWMFLKSYEKFRVNIINNKTISMLNQLGSGAFEGISGEVVNVVLLMLKNSIAKPNYYIEGCDVSGNKTTSDKAKQLSCGVLKQVQQDAQLANPDSRVSLDIIQVGEKLGELAGGLHGQGSFDDPCYVFRFWERKVTNEGWIHQQTTGLADKTYSGLTNIFRWEDGQGMLANFMAEKAKAGYSSGKWKAGIAAWSKKGISISGMGRLFINAYSGGSFDTNVATIVPENEQHFLAMYCYLNSDDFIKDIRSIDKNLKVSCNTYVKVPFNLSEWSSKADVMYPNGFPLAYTDDPTQWIFHGHPCASVVWDEDTKTTTIGSLRQDYTVLQVAIARLLGYQWPAELDPEMELAPEMREVMKKNADFAGLIDDDGIVCIPAVRGEKTAAKRLETILH